MLYFLLQLRNFKRSMLMKQLILLTALFALIGSLTEEIHSKTEAFDRALNLGSKRQIARCCRPSPMLPQNAPVT